MYHALTGRPPFQAASVMDTLKQVQEQEPVSLRQFNSAVPHALETICLKCLRKDPAQRYATASLLAADLRDWQRGQGSRKQERIFVSHSTKDRDFVEREIISLLEKNGLATWYAKVDIQTAVEWERSIKQGLESTDWFLLVMSPRSLTSEWVMDELHWAINNRPKRIIPVLIDECEPLDFHIRLARIQFVDFRRNPDEARRRLLAIFQTGAAAG